ncbi:hypothetical protein C8A00DRAFT_12783, partial [Chaetomidium leptoderma]
MLGAARNSSRPIVPDRYSSAIFSYWTGLNKANTAETPAEEDPYLTALKQLSATHRPSLDDLPLHRSIPIDAPRPTPYDNFPQPNPIGGRAGESSGEPRATGRRYHRLADGSVYTEFVDVSAHDHHGHSSENKVRPATGVRPFNMASQTDHTRVPTVGTLGRSVPFHFPKGAGRPAIPPSTTTRHVHHDSGQDFHLYPTTTSAPDGQELEGREARRSRWLQWHTSKPKAQPHGGDGASD